MLSKKSLYMWFLCGLLIVSRPMKSPATEKPKNQLQLAGINRVVIDPGFGGEDFGAAGYIDGIYSKNINLEIAKKLAIEIREKLGLDTIMTRESDKFLPPEERAAIANIKEADLFISIQCNTHSDQKVYGIETYCLGAAADEGASQATLPEDQPSKNSDLKIILSDIKLNDKSRHIKSCLLAEHVQQSLYKYMSERYSHIKDRGVKQAPFVVLMGTEMPSIVIEVSFISNPRECKRLISEDYQNDLSKAITNGIIHYIEQKNIKKQ
jgi:N-acetylmuramoyl-L-alanine amidase